MIPAFLVKLVGEKWAPVAFFGGLALIVLAIAGTIYAIGHSAGKQGAVVHEQARTIETEQKVGKANENASTARVDDTRRQDQQKQELNDALKDAANGDDARRRAGCAILRQQGRDTTALPACR